MTGNKRKIICITTAILCILAIAVTAAVVKTGDLNLDGEVDINDAILLLQHSMFPELYPLEYEGSVDFTGDGEVDINDAILLLQHSMFPELYPIESGKYTVTFYDLGVGSSPVAKIENVSHGSFGGYPDYELYYEIGYEKSYDDKFFDVYTDTTFFGDKLIYDYGHRLDYEWYYEGGDGKLLRYDENTAVTQDLDVYAKVKRVDVEVEIPKSIANIDEKLIFNAPYTSSSRYVDLWRDAFFFNRDQVVTKLEETGIEDKMNSALIDEGEGYFGNGGVLNEELEINKTDFTYTLSQMTGGSDELSLIMTEDGKISVTQQNLSAAKSVRDAVSEASTAEAIIRAEFGQDGADSLISRLPMHILKGIYDERAEEYVSLLDEAISSVEAGENEVILDGGIHFEIDLVDELFVPMLEYVKGVYAGAAERVSKSGSNMASLVKAYHIDNPYATSFVDGYMEKELFIEDKDGDGLYTVKSLPDRYDNVLMPLKVETADALLWFTQKVSFDEIEAVITKQDNKKLGLALTNRVSELADGYYESGLPSGIVEYYKALTDDEDIAAAIEMLDEEESFDMEFFVETTISYKLCEMLYMTIMRDLGVSDAALLGYNDTIIYTENDYDAFVQRMRLTWADTYTTDMGIDAMIEAAGGDGDSAEISFGGLSATLKRYIADAMFS